MKDLYCSIDSAHPGPFAMYFWLDRVSYISDTKKGYSTRSSEHRSVLCQACAKRVGAWMLPAKEEKEQTIVSEAEQYADSFAGVAPSEITDEQRATYQRLLEKEKEQKQIDSTVTEQQ